LLKSTPSADQNCWYSQHLAVAISEAKISLQQAVLWPKKYGCSFFLQAVGSPCQSWESS